MLGDSVEVTEGYGSWWSYIPHFIGVPGYVYAYAFGYLFSLAIYRRYLDEGESLVEPYLDLLRAGGSAPPAELASRLGFDIGDPGFWSAGLDAIGVLVDEAEQLAAELDADLAGACSSCVAATAAGARRRWQALARSCAGSGPVEAAAATARALAEERPDAVLHVGIAGARGLPPLALVLGSEALYCDAAGPLVPARALPDAGCSSGCARRSRRARPPDRDERPRRRRARGRRRGDGGIRRPARVRAGGVPAVEVRVVSNEIDEPDRARWRFDEAFATLAEVLPRLVAGSVRRVSSSEPLPAPLPPETRTVGQLVAEAIRLYGHLVWAALPLGLAVAVINHVSAGPLDVVQAIVLSAGAPADGAAYAWASALVGGGRPGRATLAPRDRRRHARLPPRCRSLPWSASSRPSRGSRSSGSSSPSSWSSACRRRRAAAGGRARRADYVHALGSLATLVIVFALLTLALAFLLRDQGDTDERVAVFLADLVISPLLFLGAALLYVDQAARVRSSPRREGDAMPTYLMLTTLTPRACRR